MNTRNLGIAVVILAFVGAFAGITWVAAAGGADEKAAGAPQKQAPPTAKDKATADKEKPKKGPRIVEPQKMDKPYKSNIPMAGAFTREALQLKALGPNLIKNGSFEQGRYWPYYWDPMDRLGTLWVKGGTNGKRCVRIDTDLMESQWVPWNDKIIAIVQDLSKRTRGRPQSMARHPLPPPPDAAPTNPPYFDTVGGLHGIHYRTRIGTHFRKSVIKVVPGAIYRFSIDARGQSGGAKIFIKGFFDQRRKMAKGWMTLERNAYRTQFPIEVNPKRWQRFACTFHPARSKSTYDDNPLQAEWLGVEIYAYWPVGIYEFDNVKVDIVGYEEIMYTKEKRDAERRKPQQRVPAKRMEGKWPVF